MTTIFLTGDRYFKPEAALVYAASTIAQLALESATSEGQMMPMLATGDNPGFEEGVRRFLDILKVSYRTIPTGIDDDGKPAWDARHEVVDAMADKIVVVHTAVLESKITASLFRTVKDQSKIVIALGL